MSKVVYASLKDAKRARSNSVKTKRLKNADGKMLTISVVDADSPTFSDDISYVFRKNVKRARRANKAIRRISNAVAAKT
jgi:hypothetical protein